MVVGCRKPQDPIDLDVSGKLGAGQQGHRDWLVPVEAKAELSSWAGGHSAAAPHASQLTCPRGSGLAHRPPA